MLQILSPANGAIVNPGQPVIVKVKAHGLAKFKMMVIIGQDPIGDSQLLTSSPWEFSIQIPSGIRPGTYTLTASGATAPGQGVESEQIIIDVERPDQGDGNISRWLNGGTYQVDSNELCLAGSKRGYSNK